MNNAGKPSPVGSPFPIARTLTSLSKSGTGTPKVRGAILPVARVLYRLHYIDLLYTPRIRLRITASRRHRNDGTGNIGFSGMTDGIDVVVVGMASCAEGFEVL